MTDSRNDPIRASLLIAVGCGLLPICAWCKKVRNDQGYWTQIEAYVTSHSDATFSHGICPECMAKHYPEAARKKKHDPGPSG